jgi:CarD family transcriptional regulator
MRHSKSAAGRSSGAVKAASRVKAKVVRKDAVQPRKPARVEHPKVRAKAGAVRSTSRRNAPVHLVEPSKLRRASPAAPCRALGKLSPPANGRPAATPPSTVAHLRPRDDGALDSSRRLGFALGDHVVYPSHGVGKIMGVETHTVGELPLQMFVIAFEKERMTLRVPVNKVNSAGMRRLSSPEKMDAAVTALKGRARQRRVMWSRRAQEYEAKLNSGDPVSIAEVVRDLYRNVGQPDQSYSERQMYEAALERLAREFAAVEKIETSQAAERLEKVLRAA